MTTDLSNLIYLRRARERWVLYQVMAVALVGGYVALIIMANDWIVSTIGIIGLCFSVAVAFLAEDRIRTVTAIIRSIEYHNVRVSWRNAH